MAKIYGQSITVNVQKLAAKNAPLVAILREGDQELIEGILNEALMETGAIVEIEVITDPYEVFPESPKKKSS